MNKTATTAAGDPTRWLPVNDFSLTPQRDARWQAVGSGGASQREVGLAAVSNGALLARHVRAGNVTYAYGGAGTHQDSHLHFLYVVAGNVRLTDMQGGLLTLGKDDCIHQPGLAIGHAIELAPFAEVFEIVVPRAAGAIVLETPTQAAAPVLDLNQSAHYRSGEGLRSYFTYRDFGVAAATQDKVLIHMIRATAPSHPGGTGWHRHNISQLIFLLDGWVDLGIEGRAPFRMQAGDTMCMASDTGHTVSAFSADYAVIEVCIPAHYDTVDIALPNPK